jgi:hypothetical protein
MNRILRVLVPIVVVFFGRRFYVASLSGSGPSDASSSGAAAAQAQQQPGWITQKFAGLLQNFTGSELSPQDMRLLSLLVFVYSFVLGLVAHLVLGERGFGRALNGLIALLGAAVALFCMGWLAPEDSKDSIGWMTAGAMFASFLFLGAAVALKAFVISEADDFAVGNSTRTGEAIRSLTKGTSHGRASQDRIQRALRRP